MNRVELMIRRLGEPIPNAFRKTDAVDRAMADLLTYAINHDEGDDEQNAVLKKIIAKVKSTGDAASALIEEVDEHSCEYDDGIFEPVGSTEDIDTLLRREGFLSADVVAVVKLEDLGLIERRLSDMENPTLVDGIAPCPFCKFERQQPAAAVGPSHDIYIVVCHECNASGPFCATEDEAIEKWNARGVA